MIGELLERNKNEENKKYSIIHWQTGEPKEEGDYLTTRKTEDGKTYVCYNFWVDKKWAAVPCDHSITIAWYKIEDIKPYKEE